MKLFAIGTLAAALTFSALASAQVPAAGADRDNLSNALINSEKQSWENWRAKNTSAFEQGLAPDYRAKIATGVVDDKQTVINAVQTNDLGKYELSNFNVSYPDDKTAIVSYYADYMKTTDGKAEHFARTINSTWRFENGQWMVEQYQGQK